MKINLAAVTVFFLTTLSAHAAPIKADSYQLGSCIVSVHAGNQSNVFNIRVDLGTSYASVEFDARKERVLNFSGFSSTEHEMTVTHQCTDNKLRYRVRTGGTFDDIKGSASFEFDRESGMLTQWVSKVAVAPVSFSNGWSVGPKTTTDEINCLQPIK